MYDGSTAKTELKEMKIKYLQNNQKYGPQSYALSVINWIWCSVDRISDSVDKTSKSSKKVDVRAIP